MSKQDTAEQVRKVNNVVQTLCGLYSRIARKLGLNPSYVSRVARGERRSEIVEKALVQEFSRVQGELREM